MTPYQFSVVKHACLTRIFKNEQLSTCNGILKEVVEENNEHFFRSLDQIKHKESVN
jgi:hypothetical protein